MDRRQLWPILAVLAAGGLAIWLVGHYNFGARHFELAAAVGYCLPLVYVLLTIWIWRAGPARTAPPHPGARRALVLWFVAAWALTTAVYLAGWSGVPAVWVRVAWITVLIAAAAGFGWVAYARYGYRFARPTLRRAILVALLLLILAAMLYIARHSTGPWGQFADFFWFFVVIAILSVLCRRGPAHEPDDE